MIGVLIWENSWGHTAMNHPGHAAIKVMTDDGRESYISWWPAAAPAGARTGAFNARPGRAHTIQEDFKAELGARARERLQAGANPRPNQHNDQFLDPTRMLLDENLPVTNVQGNPQYEWVKKPDHVIWLDPARPGQGNQNETFGLNVRNMMDWWEIYKLNTLPRVVHQYRFVSKRFNCASIAMAALLAGGAAVFKKPPKAWIYYSPNDILDYARELDRKIQRVNQESNTINAQKLGSYRQFTASRDPFGGTAPLDLNSADQRDDIEIWRTEEWIRQSAVMIGRRKEQVAEIDRLMRLYWGLGETWTDANSGDKAAYIGEILSNVQTHLITKPSSDRRKAVLILGSQCMAVIRARASNQRHAAFLEFLVGTTFRD